MSEGLIALIYTCVVFLFLIFGVLFGLIRGFKKTLVRGLFLILTSLVIFGIAKLIVPIFGGINISGLGLEVEGVKQSTLSGFFSSQVSSWIDAGSTADIDGLTEVILSVSELIFSVFVFWILFIICKYLLLPLNLLLYNLIFKGAAEKEYARLKKMNKKMHGRVNAFVNNNDDFKITPINQGNPNQPNQGNNIYNPNQPSQANNNYNPNQSTIHLNFQQNKSSNGEYIPLDEYVPNFGVKEETIVEDLPCEKPSKRRLLGGLMGIPVGLFCGAMMLMPITGFMGVAKQINQYKAVAMESEEGYIQTITDGNFENIEEEYDSSIGNYVMTYSGANLLSNLTFDVLTTKKINGSKVKLSDDKKLGIQLKPVTDVYTPKVEEYSFIEAIPVGIKQGFETLSGYVSDFKYVFTKEGAASLGGFGTIGSIFPSVWNWEAFWNMTAFLSVILAFMNILPIPALDGGHVLFLLYEVITRRKPSLKFMEYAQTIGMLLLLLLLVYANANDVIRLFN